jgi:peptide/nickel transport system permease protein
VINYFIRRTAAMIPVLFGVSLIVFFSMRLAPGDPARQILGPLAPQEKVEELRRDLGLNKPIAVQYVIWLSNALRGDLGKSIASHAPTLQLVGERVGRTLELTLAALLINILVSTTAGIISAVRQYSKLDNLVTVLALFWLSMPTFWLGLMLMFVLAMRIPWLPISGSGGPLWTVDGILHLILPAMTLGLPQAGTFTRITRSSMLDVLLQDYIVTARSKGIREWRVVMKHGFRNAVIPMITLLGLQLPWLFGGSVIVETVFSWPGMGRMLTTAIFERDYPLVQATALIYTLVVIFGNYLADIGYSLADPRIRLK